MRRPLVQEKDIVYAAEIAELNEEKMQYTVVNHIPVKTEENVRLSLEQELYKIFNKYR